VIVLALLIRALVSKAPQDNKTMPTSRFSCDDAVFPTRTKLSSCEKSVSSIKGFVERNEREERREGESQRATEL